MSDKEFRRGSRERTRSVQPTHSIDEARIGIDCRSIHAGPAGIATYVRNLLREIPSLVSVSGTFPKNNFLWNQIQPPRAQLTRRLRIYHAPSYTAPLVNFSRLVVFAPDVSYLTNEQFYPYPIDAFRRWFYLASLRRADRIIVTSEFTRTELTRIRPELSDRIRLTYLGVSPEFRPDADLARRARSKFRLPAEYILHVGDIHPRRNLEQLLKASEIVGLPLVLVGRVLLGGEAVRDHPLLLTGLDLDELVGVYAGATVLGYPSSYEGFGFPLVEAMASEVPIVASTRSCIPEVCGNAAVLVEPTSGSLAEGIRNALANREALVARGRERVRQFTWQKTAQATREIYRELL